MTKSRAEIRRKRKAANHGAPTANWTTPIVAAMKGPTGENGLLAVIRRTPAYLAFVEEGYQRRAERDRPPPPRHSGPWSPFDGIEV